MTVSQTEAYTRYMKYFLLQTEYREEKARLKTDKKDIEMEACRKSLLAQMRRILLLFLKEIISLW